ncbi:hypothetical protein NF27_FH00030 [Candidatus Jidaibacter acanthamoeba]|uniref:DUF6980 domain-containing protein n=1 Tax=Candidatus Jidaibacter acanthamoebae TaxID=86105 RepID=A0A0C1QXW0_9RICK|nr:hypothetical protein NF27_FH00030 [Candidatus Jidaibacter acanthamoeba]
MSHCCKNMDYYMAKNEEFEFDKRHRLYTVKLSSSKNATHQLLYYCPWCGTKLPESLATRWFEILKAEYKLNDPIFDDANKVPEEFKTDEWWKKRGL